MRVFFSTLEYERNHGAMPRGRGSWAFVDALHARKMNYLDFVWWAPSGLTYSEAKRAAVKHFTTADGYFSGELVVCS